MKGWLGAIVLASSLALPVQSQTVDWNKAIENAGRQTYVHYAHQYSQESKDCKLAASLVPRQKEEDFGKLTAQLAASTIADIETTMYGISKGAHESIPTMKPFVARGRKALYPVQIGASLLYLGLSYELRERGEPLWAIIPRMLTNLHTIAAVSNVATGKHYDELRKYAHPNP